MAESRGRIPIEAPGMDLPFGHIHAHHYARSEALPEHQKKNEVSE